MSRLCLWLLLFPNVMATKPDCIVASINQDGRCITTKDIDEIRLMIGAVQGMKCNVDALNQSLDKILEIAGFSHAYQAMSWTKPICSTNGDAHKKY